MDPPKMNISSLLCDNTTKTPLSKQEVFKMNCNHENINKPGLATETLNVEVESVTMPPLTVATMRAAIQGFKQVFHIDLTTPGGYLLSMAFHTSILTSLLQQLGEPFPLAFRFLTEDASSWERMISLFSCYDDYLLSLDSHPDVFATELLSLRDQPMVILAEHSEYSEENLSLLDSVLTSHQISRMDGQQEKVFPVQALPIILSPADSTFTVHPRCLTWEIPTRFAVPVPNAISESVKTAYRAAFTQYASYHIHILQHRLSSERFRASAIGENNLTDNCTAALGILLAIDGFVRDFYRDCGLAVPQYDEVDSAVVPWLLKVLMQVQG